MTYSDCDPEPIANVVRYEIRCNFNRIELDSWIEPRKLLNGDWLYVGMGRCTEYDATTGAIVSNKVEPTGLTMTMGDVQPKKTLLGWLFGH